jgi:hypothetical protein
VLFEECTNTVLSEGRSRSTRMNQPPASALREVPLLLRTQWKAMLASPSTLLRWTVASDEWEWVEHFLEGRMDGRSKVFAVELAADSLDGYGFEASRTLLGPLAATKVPGRAPWTCGPLPTGVLGVEVLATMLASFASYVQGSWLANVVVLLAPSRVTDERAWLKWVAAFAGAVATIAPSVRVLLLDDSERPRHEPLAHQYGAAVCTVPAALGIATRTTAMVEAAADASSVQGQLRVLAVRTLQCVSQRRPDEAERHVVSLERLANENGRPEAIVPVRFSVAGGFTAAQRHEDAVRSYRIAEVAAERAQSIGVPNGAFLRVLARFGVAAGLLAAPQGAALAARYYEETAPLCAAIPDAKLEFESHRAAAVAHELAGAPRPAWDASIRALAVVDRLTASERSDANLVPLVDAVLRLTETRALASFRSGMENQLRTRGLRGTRWA